MTRRYARAHRSRRSVGHAPASWGKNTTLTGAMTEQGMLVLSRLLGGGTTKASFLAFVQDKSWPSAHGRSNGVLDSLSAHKSAEVRAAMCRVLFVPPYPPRVNPVRWTIFQLSSDPRSHAQTPPRLPARVPPADRRPPPRRAFHSRPRARVRAHRSRRSAPGSSQADAPPGALASLRPIATS